MCSWCEGYARLREEGGWRADGCYEEQYCWYVHGLACRSGRLRRAEALYLLLLKQRCWLTQHALCIMVFGELRLRDGRDMVGRDIWPRNRSIKGYTPNMTRNITCLMAIKGYMRLQIPVYPVKGVTLGSINVLSASRQIWTKMAVQIYCCNLCVKWGINIIYRNKIDTDATMTSFWTNCVDMLDSTMSLNKVEIISSTQISKCLLYKHILHQKMCQPQILYFFNASITHSTSSVLPPLK